MNISGLVAIFAVFKIIISIEKSDYQNGDCVVESC